MLWTGSVYDKIILTPDRLRYIAYILQYHFLLHIFVSLTCNAELSDYFPNTEVVIGK